jgi:hypothetical protein
MAKVLVKGKGRQDLLEKYALEAITREKTESYSSQDMKDGIEVEPFIRTEYEFITENTVNTVALVKSIIPGLHCSPDGLIDSKNGMGGLEIKKRIRKVQFSYAIERKNGWQDEWKDGGKQDKLTQGIPSNPEYIQVQTSLFVTKRVFWDYCSAVVIFKEDPYTGERKMSFDYALNNDWIIIQRVYRDEKLIKRIKTETLLFLAELNLLIRKMG